MAIIDKPTDYFNTVLYTGNGYPTAGTQSITGVGFQPDWLWIKDRDAAQNNNLSDVIRGASFRLKSNASTEESELTDSVVSHDSDGFSVGTGSDVNQNSDKYVAWNWKANGAGSLNEVGSIDSTVSANTTSGFSIVSYTGTGANATVGHGLGVAPKMVILKSRANAYNWGVYHASIGATKYLRLNATNAEATSSAYFQNTAPSNTLITLGSDLNINDSGNMIAYCFAEKQGYSKFGSYTGNGSTDGTFVYLGFKPAFVMIKCSSEGGSYPSWSMFDTTRQTFNVNAGKTLYANKSSAEGVRGNGSDSSTTIPAIDMLSNGFKCRVLNDEVNNTAEYIYMAFAENPLVTSTGVCATAR